MLPTDTLPKLTDLAYLLAPELAVAPLYIKEQPECWPLPEWTLGCAQSGKLSTVVIEHLTASGEYRGPGPFIALRPDMPRAQTLQVLVHEIAHCLPQAPVEVPPLTEESRREDEKAAALWYAADPPAAVEGLPRWITTSHDRRFHRIALHLWWRLALLGEPVPLHGLCGGMVMDLSPSGAYWNALGGEAVRMQHLTFSEILSEREPAAFRELWESDIDYFLKREHGAAK